MKDMKIESIKIPEELLEILACPNCKGDLINDEINSELVCKNCNLAYAVKDGIPVMLIDEARKINLS